jgi:uncharacterized protein (DUF2126 family)
MGAWGVLAFDNDDANDWAYGLDEVNDLSLVESALQEVEAVGTEYLELPTASNALAAAEVLARLRGRPGYTNAYTEKVDQWVAAHQIAPDPGLINRAEAAIDRIVGSDSELRQVWEEADLEPWLKAVSGLRARLV